MPSVPTYQRRLSIPGKAGVAPADESSVTEISRAQSGLSNELMGLSGDILRIRNQIKEQQDETTALNINTAIDDDYRTFLVSELAKTGQDSYDAMTRADEFVRSSTEKHTKDYQDNRRVKALVTEYIAKRSKTLKDKLALHELDQRTAATNSSISRANEGILKDVYSGAYTAVEGVERFTEAVSRLHDKGAIGQDKATELIVQGNQKIAEAHLDGVISRDPQKALELIESGAYNKYMKQEKIEEYDKKAKAIAKTMKTEQEKNEEKALKIAKDKAGNDVVTKILKGDHSGATNDLESDSVLTPEDRIKFTNFNEKRLNGDEVKTNMNVYAIAKAEAKHPEKYEDVQDFVTRVLSDDISESDKRTLINDFVSNQSPEKKGTSELESNIYVAIDEERNFEKGLALINKLPGEKQGKYRTHLDKKVKEAGDKTESDKFIAAMDDVEKNYAKYTLGDLVKKYGTDLTNTNFNALEANFKALKSDIKIENKETAKHIMNMMKDYKKIGVFDVETGWMDTIDEQKSIDNYHSKVAETLNWLRQNPKATPEQAQDYINKNLIPEEKKGLIARIVNKIFPKKETENEKPKLKTTPRKETKIIQEIEKLKAKGYSTDKIKGLMEKASIDIEIYKDELEENKPQTKKTEEKKKEMSLTKIKSEIKKEPPVYLLDEEM